MKEHHYSVYMIASKSRVLYIGMTNELRRRVFEHRNDLIDGFTRQYKCHRLVYYESFDDVNKAIDREKQLKRWNRTKKEWLNAQRNPTWEDFAAAWSLRPSEENRLRSERSLQSRNLLFACSIDAAEENSRSPPREQPSASLIVVLGRDDRVTKQIKCTNALTSPRY